MWNTLAQPWQICIEQAWEAYCHGSLPIGAAITDSQGRVLARGRNRIYEGEAEGRLLCGHQLAHAEVNALISLDWAATDPRACVLYTTTEPCTFCAGAVRQTRLGEVRYAARDGAARGVGLFEASPSMRRGKVHVVEPTQPWLEAVLIALLAEFALGQDDENTPTWCERLAEAVPAGVALGADLHRSGELRSWRNDGHLCASVIDMLAARVGG
ncbi:MAG: nucleoside deaminase [Ktedonobacterales bacterium]